MRYVCIHGHFYQPPRENPWLETIERQESALPFHDWNERIAAECYEPNAEAGNYARISFDFGPTLLSWLEEQRPAVYEAVLAADRASSERFGGHGSAMAQAYNHAILPLANERDRRTQVRWGIRDFTKRFGRHPEGMWLPETAADSATLTVLADEGIRFTILAPSQLRRARAGDDGAGSYHVALPDGRKIAVFCYDGALSAAIAFERLLASGEELVRRFVAAFPAPDGRPRLVHVATDGETYGHHHRFGEMALTWALERLQSLPGVRLTNYGEYLELHPPVEEAALVESSSWSCAHGVGRWSEDCGCSIGSHPGWHQRWRRPLRQAFDWLRDEIAPRWVEAAGALLRDPWRARDDYIDVVLDRSSASTSELLAREASRPLDAAERVRALELLELQRQLLLMYTSCAWFFDDVSGIESLQVLHYADRALELSAGLLGAELEPGFLERLALAPTNLETWGNARRLFELRVRPDRVEPSKLAANVAAGLPFSSVVPLELCRAWRVEVGRPARDAAHGLPRAVGRMLLESRSTGELQEFDFVAMQTAPRELVARVTRAAGGVDTTLVLTELLVDTQDRLAQHLGGQRDG